MTILFDLERFMRAQDEGGTYERALGELRNGRKESHWMWFVFPQLAGLAASPMSVRYAISALAEASAYLAHRLLGSRLVQCAGIVASVEGRTAEEIFGEVDALKLCSSMTLFSQADPKHAAFQLVIDRLFEGNHDALTIALLDASRGANVDAGT